MNISKLSLAVAGGILLLPISPQAGSSAAGRSGWAAARQQLKQMKVADGLEVTLFACEPMLVNPANMDVDAKGRVWVTEGANYRAWSHTRPAGDRIVILEDTNGDGVADKATTFYQGNDINTALGICVLGNKVIVSCSPNVFVFTDANGDGIADKKELLFTGISGVQHDHGVHAFVFGPDGKLYFCMGNESRQVKYPDGRPVIDNFGNLAAANGHPYRNGFVFRCNLDGSHFQTLAYNFRNNYEVCVDSFGAMWQSDNDDDGNKSVRINYVMDYGNFGYSDEMTGAGWTVKRSGMAADIPHRHWHQNDPGVIPNLLFTGAGAPTGILAYEGRLLPKIFWNHIIHCDAGPRVVRAYCTTPDGAGYKAKIVDILTSSDTWFRPSDVCVGPDGSLYVADWNDAAVGGHYMADQDLATMTGRVYRIAPPGHKPVVPPLDLNSPEGAARALQSPNLATRYLAWTALRQMNQRAEPVLDQMWRGENPRWRARAWELLARIPGEREKYFAAAMQDADPDIRCLPLRFTRAEELDPIPAVKALLKDPSPEVRRECALCLHDCHSPETPELWATLAQQYDGQDRWYLEALGIGADRQWDACFDAWLARVGDDWNTPSGRGIIWRSRSKKTPGYLLKLINDKNTGAQRRARYFRSLDFIQGPEKEAVLLQLLTGAVEK